ncbi:hypothetical protein IAR55_006772 [Kwoniella newhampshirensis]|uniref:Autophagy-related protein n=1 Tax=Kwoniella newhampshirensis TaxID=1651941 RepID=A0AAW0YGG6_9TREE
MSSSGGRLPHPHVRAWYSYAFATEVFSACALAIFLPITLEQMAREVGYYAPELVEPCVINGTPSEGIERICKAKILGVWVDTASFSMYVKSVAVATQAVCIISVGPLADSPYWRKRLLLVFAYTGALSGIMLLFFPSTPYTWTPLLAALLNTIGNATYSSAILCSNAFLRDLAREDEDVQKALKEQVDMRAIEDDSSGGNDERGGDERTQASIDSNEGTSLLPKRLVPTVRAISTEDLAETDPIASPYLTTSPKSHYETLLSLTTSRLSSTGTALGFFSGVSVLTLLFIPITVLGGTTFALRLAIGLSGIWWAVFTLPSWLGLPGGQRSPEDDVNIKSIKEAWIKIGKMVSPSQIRQLPNLYLFLMAWIFLSDGFHTTTYVAILYASAVLSMGPPKIMVIGILTQLSAMIAAILVPRYQRMLSNSDAASSTTRKPVTNFKILLLTVIGAALIPLYASAGLIVPYGGLRSEAEMYIFAAWFGFIFGPFLSYSRTVYSELIPPGHESTFFALFSFTDKSASFLGPTVVGLIADLTGNARYGFIFLLLMLTVPIPVLLRVNVRKGTEEARIWTETRSGGRTAHASTGHVGME